MILTTLLTLIIILAILYKHQRNSKIWDSIYWNSTTKRFYHPWKPSIRILTLKALWKIIIAPKVKWPKKVLTENNPIISTSNNLIITNIGHATFLIQMAGANIITDPVFSNRAGPFGKIGPKRVAQPGIPIELLPPIDIAFISHNHYDHLDKFSVIYLAEFHDLTFVVPLGVKQQLLKWGITRPIIELDWWKHYQSEHIKVTAVPAQHWSRRGLFDTNKTLWMGGMFESNHANIFFAGDTGLGPHFTEIANKFKKIDVGLLPIGSYKPFSVMRQQHMGPADALKAHQILNTKTMIPIHYDVFQLGKEAFSEAETDLINTAKELQIPLDEIKILKVGQQLQ